MKMAGGSAKRLNPARLTLLLLPLIASCGGGGGGGDSGGGGNGGGSPTYRILAANDLGMHCVDADFSVFSILPPYNVVAAQVIRTDARGRPQLLGEGAVQLRYSPIPDATGSVNSRSIGKSNFWQYAGRLFGANLAPGEGLKGLYMPADAADPGQTALRWIPAAGLFKAEGVPILPVDDAGHANRYPLMRLEAMDATSGVAESTLDIVLPVSEETTCADCHATGAVAATTGGIDWSTTPDREIQSRENVLLLHDQRHGTSLNASRPVLCASCHYSAALDLAGAGPGGTQSGHRTMSAVMHDFHADLMQDAAGRPLDDRWTTQGALPPDPARQSCYECHPGRSTRCLRGAMTDTVTCQNCHGNMRAVGGAAPLRAGGSLDGTNDGRSRRPWLDLPRCQSCHTGDAGRHATASDPALMATDGIRMLVAFAPEDPAASPLPAAASRFAENAGQLFRFSKGHGGVACEGCHNSTHAIWPNADDSANDNVAAGQLQGHAGTIVECVACHGPGTLSATLGGPHGMHPVDDARWTDGGHGELADGNPRACAACHGTDYRGTVLSRTAAVRTWSTGSGRRSVAAGLPVGCYDCHNGPGGGD